MLKKSYREIVLLILIPALTFLPYAARLTYYLDDWYYVYDGLVGGAKIFHPMFSIDRPARGYFFDLYFSLFGAHPLPYHIGAYLWRALAGIGAFWLFSILWKEHRKFNFFAAVLFVLYPGYAWWVSAIEYQPMIASLALQVLSVVLMLKAIQASKLLEKIIFAAGAILTGWAYIALVDYAIGMEAFRFICVYLLVSRNEQTVAIWKKFLVAIKAWAWSAIIPLGFIFWRTFFFENQRKATDVNLQLSKMSFGKEIANLFQSIADVSFNAWFKQFYDRLFDAGFEISILGLILAVSVAVLLIRASSKSAADNNQAARRVAGEALLLGATSLVVGVLPVVAANRLVNLNIYSHYGLPASIASAVLLAGVIRYLFSSEKIRVAVLVIFAVLATLTHSLIGEKALAAETAIQKFWWQASWRMPGLRPDTTLITVYPYPKIADEDYGVTQPPNMIYFSEPQSQRPIRYPVSTMMPTNANVELILANAHKKTDGYRTHEELLNYGNILILTQPTPSSCVRVIDGSRYLLSENDSGNVKKIAPYSKIENVRSRVAASIPQEFAFGAEPNHDWCYYFERADLAVQNMDWQAAAKLGDEALQAQLSPADAVEWFPFLQAYAMTGDENKLAAIAAEINQREFLKKQVCAVFNQPNASLALDTRAKELIDNLFCK